MTDREEVVGTWALFLRAHALLIGELEQELVETRGLPLTWYDVLVQLAHAPEGRLRMSDLQQAVVLSKSGLTRCIDRMVDAGLVRREGCPDDRRGVYAVICAEGRSALRQAAPVHLDGIERHFGQYLSPEEAAILRQVFRRIVDAFQDGPAQCSGVVPLTTEGMHAHSGSGAGRPYSEEE